MPSNYLSTLKNAVRGRIQNLVVGHEGVLQDYSLLVEIGQGKLWFGNSRLFHSIPVPSLSELQQVVLRPGTVSTARSDSRSVNQRRNLSVVGVLSRTLSIPSVSGPSFQVCGYHIDHALSDSGQISVTSKLLNKPKAALGSKAVFGQRCLENFVSRREHCSLSTNSYSANDVYGNGGSESCWKVSTSLKNQGQPNNGSAFGYYIYKAAKSRFHYSTDIESESRDFHSLPCTSAGTVSDVFFDNSIQDEQMVNSAISSEDKALGSKTLKLLSGSCYLPHPDKEETGGEDAHFICDEQAVGVADGVGGWADLGVDAGEYSRELMSNSVSAIQEEPKGSIDPVRVLEKAHSSTRAKGSSTACIIALTDQGLHAINLGDSGFMVVRDGCSVFRSPVQQHDFNLTYQLECGNNGDLPSSGQVFSIPIAPGDVIISGTDGLFDNLYNNEITAVAVHALRAGFGPQVTSQKIAALARQRAMDKDRQTPFSTAAQEAGFRYHGGKLDDITVVVSYVARGKQCSSS